MDATKHTKTAKAHVNAGYPTSTLFVLYFNDKNRLLTRKHYLHTVCVKPYPNYINLEQFEVTDIFYTRKTLTICSKSANKPSTRCVRTACYKLSTSLEQAVNNL